MFANGRVKAKYLQHNALYLFILLFLTRVYVVRRLWVFFFLFSSWLIKLFTWGSRREMKNNKWFFFSSWRCLNGVCNSHACFVMQISLKMVLPVHLKYILELFYHEISFLRHWLSWIPPFFDQCWDIKDEALAADAIFGSSYLKIHPAAGQCAQRGRLSPSQQCGLLVSSAFHLRVDFPPSILSMAPIYIMISIS